MYCYLDTLSISIIGLVLENGKEHYIKKEHNIKKKPENLTNKNRDVNTSLIDKGNEDEYFFVRKEFGEKVYFCNFCDKNFTSRGGVLYHASRKHISNGGKSSVDNNSHENTILR